MNLSTILSPLFFKFQVGVAITYKKLHEGTWFNMKKRKYIRTLA